MKPILHGSGTRCLQSLLLLFQGGACPIKAIKYTENTERRDTTKNPDLTCNLHVKVEISPNIKNDPMVDTHLSVVGFRNKTRNYEQYFQNASISYKYQLKLFRPAGLPTGRGPQVRGGAWGQVRGGTGAKYEVGLGPQVRSGAASITLYGYIYICVSFFLYIYLY